MVIVTINEYKINPEMYFKLLNILKTNYNNKFRLLDFFRSSKVNK